MNNLIKFSDYIYNVNEGLIKTYDGKNTVDMIDNEMSLMCIYDFDIK